MSKSKDEIDDEIFEALLGPASREALRREMEEMPSLEELDKMYPISDTLNKRVMNIIDNHEKSHKKKQRMKKISKFVAGFTLLSAVTGTVLMSVEASRNFIRNSIVNMRGDHAILEFSGESGNDSSVIAGYIPEGFQLVNSNSTGNTSIFIYSNDIGELVIIRQHPADYLALGVDTDIREFSIVNMGGQSAYLFQTSDSQYETVLVWNINNNVFDITSTLEIEQILKIAENLIFE